VFYRLDQRRQIDSSSSAGGLVLQIEDLWVGFEEEDDVELVESSEGEQAAGSGTY
jgi:hypothetical protein